MIQVFRIIHEMYRWLKWFFSNAQRPVTKSSGQCAFEKNHFNHLYIAWIMRKTWIIRARDQKLGVSGVNRLSKPNIERCRRSHHTVVNRRAIEEHAYILWSIATVGGARINLESADRHTARKSGLQP